MRYDRWKWGVEPFKPNHMVYQGLAVLPVLMLLVAVIVFVPEVFMLKQEPADTLSTPADIKPEWYFLPAYQALKLFPKALFGDLAEFVGVLAQMLFLLAVLLLPFWDRNPERHPARRRRMMAAGAIVALGVVILGLWGHFAPPVTEG